MSIVFIHIPKTAGRTISTALRCVCEESNNYLDLKHRHRPAIYIKNNIFRDDVKWDKSYKITFIRNPWQRAVSLWKYTYNRKFYRKTNIIETKINQNMIDDFKYWLLTDSNQKINNKTVSKFNKRFWGKYPKTDILNHVNPLSALSWISDLNGNILVDFIGRFEHIDGDFSKINKKFNTNCEVRKSSQIENKFNIYNQGYLEMGFGTNYQDFYDDESYDYIADVCKWEIEKFNYKFEQKKA